MLIIQLENTEDKRGLKKQHEILIKPLYKIKIEITYSYLGASVKDYLTRKVDYKYKNNCNNKYP